MESSPFLVFALERSSGPALHALRRSLAAAKGNEVFGRAHKEQHWD